MGEILIGLGILGVIVVAIFANVFGYDQSPDIINQVIEGKTAIPPEFNILTFCLYLACCSLLLGFACKIIGC